ncbi:MULTISPECIES: helix-turn-helix transcriptional regulator [Gordonia]|uniref:Helix-turn-helix domain-containing protein n=1 Tax=Gordonia amicalis TaxID=89053 RepID=A0AAE4QZI1_9ACTN|nr:MULTISPECIES: helix-turn-helix domain-containing protein [Gordonia]MCZ4577774.1 helix-turn-helix domain-containing protein [Gordonia amicalis]MCZ4652394.1 helix-turn-helix domain-containing protein [Gordonia amicalis]MDJ0451231.1 helix-turn-helix domain-containing protein [Gordonia amicalis]MDV6310598.1 helix-turn-helix domain-containing protein [Gordonia amicalis]MDV7074613.1 helix-turn-helix domain-containing protein [Gordonia amicalis]
MNDTIDVTEARSAADAAPAPVLPADHSVLLDERQAAYLAGLSPFTMRNIRKEGRGPRYVKLARRIRYRRLDVELWIEQHVAA